MIGRLVARGRLSATTALGACCLVVVASALTANGLAFAQHAPAMTSPAALSPEEKMNRRYPQPVKVGDLVGLRVLDDDDVTIGYVQQVTRTAQGKVVLVVSYGGLFGWRGRDVGVPIEAVAIFGRQLASLDMQPKDYAAAPNWVPADGRPIAPDQKILIGLTRR